MRRQVHACIGPARLHPACIGERFNSGGRRLGCLAPHHEPKKRGLLAKAYTAGSRLRCTDVKHISRFHPQLAKRRTACPALAGFIGQPLCFKPYMGQSLLCAMGGAFFPQVSIVACENTALLVCLCACMRASFLACLPGQPAWVSGSGFAALQAACANVCVGPGLHERPA